MGSLPHAAGSDTSEAAARSMEPHAGMQAQRVLDCIGSAGMRGATCDEVEVALGLSHQSASARVEKLHTTGLVVDLGERRKTRSGRKAVVWYHHLVQSQAVPRGAR